MDLGMTAPAYMPVQDYLDATVANPFLAGKHRPLVVGHRGVQTLHQENTLSGFRRAVALGLDAIELDVRVTRDGHAVVFHDASLERLTGVRRAISDLTWDEVAALRIRSRIVVGVDALGSDVIARYEHDERISLLAEVLAEVGGRVAVNIDLKSRWLGGDVAGIVAAAIASAGVRERVLVTSFDPWTLRSIGRLDRELALGYCWEESTLGFAGLSGRRLLNRLLDTNFAGRLLGTRAVGANHTLVGPETVRRLHRANVAIGAHVLFPIGSPHRSTSHAEAERLVELGVDWIESDDPERLQRIVS
jgi:glycerophosphoryl diester phosphodiesterase